MFNNMIENFMKFRFSPWWYLFLGVLLYLFTNFLIKVKQKSNKTYEQLQQKIFLFMLIPIFIIIFLGIGLFMIIGFSGDSVHDIFGILLLGLGVVLILISLVAFVRRLQNKKQRLEGDEEVVVQKTEFEVEEVIGKVDNRKAKQLVWVLWVLAMICFFIAMNKHNLVCFITSIVLGTVMLIIRGIKNI